MYYKLSHMIKTSFSKKTFQNKICLDSQLSDFFPGQICSIDIFKQKKCFNNRSFSLFIAKASLQQNIYLNSLDGKILLLTFCQYKLESCLKAISNRNTYESNFNALITSIIQRILSSVYRESLTINASVVLNKGLQYNYNFA